MKSPPLSKDSFWTAIAEGMLSTRVAAVRPLARRASVKMGAMPIGLMLYTVREDCARDFEGTLRAVAALGYEGVELFDLHGHEAARVRGWLDELGLPVCAAHARLEALETRLPELTAEARTLGHRRLVVSWIDPDVLAADADAVAARIARV